MTCSLASGRVRKIVLRTPEEKADLALSWSRPDEEFFASGACHVLAAALLRTFPKSGFEARRIRPTLGQRAGHVVVAREDVVFDCRGYTCRKAFFGEYRDAVRRLILDWDAEFVPLDLDPIGWDYCRATRSRHPSQFFQDPMPRALAYMSRFAPPT